MEDKDIIKELYIKLCDASINKDVDTLNKILADDYVLIHMTGKRQSKQDYINSVLSGELNYYESIHESIEVNIDRDRATIIGKTIRIVTTHEGSGLASVPSDVKRICKGANVLNDCLAIRGADCKNARNKIESWI